MTKIFASVLALTIGTTGAWAASHSTSDMSDGAKMMVTAESIAEDMSSRDNLIRTRDITGGEVYTLDIASADDWSFDIIHNGVGEEWKDIGEIEDIILNRSGQMIGIVAEIGGFLDIADKHVVIPITDVNLVAVDDRGFAILTRFSEEQLEQMQSVDEGFWN
jgi:hypothetical protein